LVPSTPTSFATLVPGFFSFASLVKREAKERELGIKVVAEKAFNENWFNKTYN